MTKKEEQPSLKKNYVYRVFYEILILITPFVTTPYVSRVLGADGIGDYSFTHSIITYFMLLAALGTVSYGSREIARLRDDKWKLSKAFWEIELMTIGTTGLCILVWIVVIIFGTKYRYFYLSLTPFLLATMFDISWFFTGLEKIKNIVVRNSLIRILSIVLLFALVKEKDDVIKYCIIHSGSAMIGNLSMWLYLPGMIERVDVKVLRFKHHFRETLIYFIPSIATSVYTVLDKTLIGAITESSSQNGYYEQATKIITIVKSVVFVAVNSIMSARISYLFAQEKFEEIKKRIEKSMDFILLLAVGAISGLWGISHRFVPVFFGVGFEPVEWLIYLMSPLVVIVGISNCLGSHYYTPFGKRAQSARYLIMGSLVNLILNITFIPFFMAYGAVIASLIAELTITVLYVRNSDGYINAAMLVRLMWKRLIAGLIMSALVYAIGQTLECNRIIVLLIQILSGITVYGVVLYFLKDSMLFELYQMIFNKAKQVLRRRV